jgi:hypothetical protein
MMNKEARREGPLAMDKKEYGSAQGTRGERVEASEVIDLHQMLHKIDKTVEAFYEIHGPLIKDQCHDQ